MGNNISLPRDMVVYVVQYMDKLSIVSLSLVSKEFQRILSTHSSVLEWKRSQLAEKLRLVSSAGLVKSVIVFLEKGAEPNWGIRAAAEGGHTAIVEFLLAKGASPNLGIEVAACGTY